MDPKVLKGLRELEVGGRERGRGSSSSSSREGEWVTVSSPGKRRPSGMEPPILTHHQCPLNIYQMPRFYNEQTVVPLVNDVVYSGRETMRFFQEVVKGVYPKLLIILRGVPGSGKSSIAAALVATTRKGTVCSADDYFTDGKGVYKYNHGRLAEAHKEAQNKCRKLMEKDISPIIIDNTNTRRFEMEPYVKYAIEKSYAVQLFEPETAWKFDVKVLAAKNVHQVPKAKVQEMLDRYEQVMPHMLINDVRKGMGRIGEEYSPLKCDDFPLAQSSACGLPYIAASQVALRESQELLVRLKGPLSPPPNPNLFEFVQDSLIGSPKGTLAEEESVYEVHGMSSRLAAVFPVESDKLEDLSYVEGKNDVSNYCLTDQNVPFSTGEKNRTGKTKPKVTPKLKPEMPPPQDLNIALPNKLISKDRAKCSHEVLIEGANKLTAFFPTYSFDVLYDVAKKLNGDVDEALNIMMDSGYELAKEINLDCPESDVTPDTKYPTSSSSATSMYEMPKRLFDQNASTSKMSGDFDVQGAAAMNVPPAPSARRGTDPPNDNQDWFNLTLPKEDVLKMVEKFGNANDPRIKMLVSQDTVNCRIPLEMGFEFYAKICANAEARACREAESIAKD